jgi:hypothetical protein
MNDYEIEDGVLYVDIKMQNIKLRNEIFTVLERYSNYIDFPATIVFNTEPTLYNFLKKTKTFYVITCDKNNPLAIEATNRAKKYKENPGLTFISSFHQSNDTASHSRPSIT